MEVFAVFLLVAVFLGSIILTPILLRSKERMRLIELVRAGTDKGEPMPPELLRTLMSEPKPNRPSHIRDIRRGVILLALALAVEIIALCIYSASIFGESDARDLSEAVAVGIGIAGFGAIPGCIGLAFIGLGMTGRKTTEP